MYSHVGIIIGAVVSAIFGLYIFVPDGGLRTFDYWLSIWKPIVWDASAVVHSPFFEQEGANQSPLRLSVEEEKDVVAENQLPVTREEEFMERMREVAVLFGLDIEPLLAPRVEPDPPSRMLCSRKAVHSNLVALYLISMPYLLPGLLAIAMAQKTYALRKVRKLYEAEKRKDAELLEEQKGEGYLDKKNQSELPDTEGLPVKPRRPGKRSSKREHKAAKRRTQAEKKAAMRAEEALEETHEKK